MFLKTRGHPQPAVKYQTCTTRVNSFITSQSARAVTVKGPTQSRYYVVDFESHTHTHTHTAAVNLSLFVNAKCLLSCKRGTIAVLGSARH